MSREELETITEEALIPTTPQKEKERLQNLQNEFIAKSKKEKLTETITVYKPL